MTSHETPFDSSIPEDAGEQSVDFHIVARGSATPEAAKHLHERVVELFSGIEGLSYSVKLNTGQDDLSPAYSSELRTLDQDLDRWLSSSILNDMHDIAGDFAQAVNNCLVREGLSSYREVLLFGRTALRNIRSFGEVRLQHVENAIARNPFGITLTDKPTLEDAAMLCNSIFEVPARFAYGKHDYPWLKFGPGATVGEIITSRREDDVPSTRTQLDPEGSGKLIEVEIPPAAIAGMRLAEIKVREPAEVCATNFYRLKQQLQDKV